MPEGEVAEAIEAVNASLVPVVSVDIPSGVDGATGAAPGAVIRADLTVTFGAAKTGAVLLPGAEHAGDVRVVDIGFPDDLLPDTCGLTEPDDVVGVLPERATDAHKKASGTLVIVAGSRRMTGAVRLLAHAAGRIGAGYVVVAVPASILPVVQLGLTETVFLPLAETEDGTVAQAAHDAVLEALADADALAMGPGLSTNAETQAFVRGVLRESPVPVVLDADGLNAFAGDEDLLADRKTEVVLTPHLGELARLTGGHERRPADRGAGPRRAHERRGARERESHGDRRAGRVRAHQPDRLAVPRDGRHRRRAHRHDRRAGRGGPAAVRRGLGRRVPPRAGGDPRRGGLRRGHARRRRRRTPARRDRPREDPVVRSLA